MEKNRFEEAMHKSSMLRMRWFADTFLEKGCDLKILDVGSYDVNGCYKDIFINEGYSYTGLDMEGGKNVDIVPSSPYMWPEIEDDSYDAVISGQALEHIEFFWITVCEMVRVLKEGGVLCIVAPNGFEEHRYPVDCWRFFTDGMVALARYTNLETLHAHTNCGPDISASEWFSEDCADSMLIARKPYSGKARTVDMKEYRCIPADQERLRGKMIRAECSKNMSIDSRSRTGGYKTSLRSLFRKVVSWHKK